MKIPEEKVRFTRDMGDLTPFVKDKAEEVVVRCAQLGFVLLVYCTYRSAYEQARLYRRSRTRAQIRRKQEQMSDEGFYDLAVIIDVVGPQGGAGDLGHHLTMAGPGESWHNYNRAFDAVPLIGGKAAWNDEELYRLYGGAVVASGLEWAGNWKGFPENPHAQQIGASNPLDDLMPEEVPVLLAACDAANR